MERDRERDRTSSKALFPKGPSFEEKDFSIKDFVVRDFVDELADTATPVNRRSGPAQSGFDPKPLIRTFENALSQLGGLSETLEQAESGLQADVRRAEMQHDRTLDTLGRKLDESMLQFEALDSTLNSNNENGTTGALDRRARQNGGTGGNVAVQIGERLEALDKKRARALDAQFLIKCWKEVSETGRLTSLEEIQRQSGADNKVRCAVIARQLMRISQRLDPTSWGIQKNGALQNGVTNGVTGASRKHNTRELLEKFSEILEQDLLTQFNDSYRNQGYASMMECSRVLFDFNGGASVIGLFVNQHDFFINKDQLIGDDELGDQDTWEVLADPDADKLPGVDKSLGTLIDAVRDVTMEESFIIKQAFPQPETVIIRFILRIFQQSIQQRLELVLDKASSISTLAFLRSLHAARACIASMVDDLKAHGLIESPEPCTVQVSQTLDQQMEELFVPYLVGNSYIERERKSLDELYSSLLFKYRLYHDRRKKAPTGFMAAIAQQGSQLVATAKDAYTERLESSELTPTQKSMMLRVAGLQDSGNKHEVEVVEEDGVMKVETARKLIKWMAESVQRLLELGRPADMAKDVNALLGLLLKNLGETYVEAGLLAALDRSRSQENIKTEPDMTYLPSLQPAVTVASLMSRFTQTVLIRLAEGNTTVRRNMEAQAKTRMDLLEKTTNDIIKSTVDVVLNWVTRSLATQKKTDYRQKEADLDLTVTTLQTPTCQNICGFLGRVNVLASQAINGQNLEGLSSDLALSIYGLLFDHFKKFSVNATGGITLTNDIKGYVETLKQWQLTKETQSTIEVLTEVGYLFVIQPEALRERSRNLATGPAGQGQQAKKLQKADFKAFVQRREDSGSVGVQSVLAGL